MTRPLPASPGDRMHASALRIADDMAFRAAEIGVEVRALANGARLIDAGVAAPGSHEAGRLYAEACLGGLGRVAVGVRLLGPAALAEARVTVDSPLHACMASQYAGWKIQVRKFFAAGSHVQTPNSWIVLSSPISYSPRSITTWSIERWLRKWLTASPA